MNADGTNPTNLTTNPASDAYADWGVAPALATTALRVAKTCSPTTVHPNATVTCTVTVTNDGPAAATGVSSSTPLTPP